MTADTMRSDFLKIPTTALILSGVLHGAILILLSMAHLLDKLGFSFWPKPLDENRVYQDFIQVDVVALPDQLLNDKIDTALPVVETPVPLPFSKLNAKEDIIVDSQEAKKEAERKQKDLAKQKELERTAKLQKDQQAALKKIKADAERERALKGLATNENRSGRAKLKGNRASSGTSTSGLIGTPKDRYAGLVKKAIQEHFSVYPWQKQKKLVAVVYIEIMANGRIREKELIKPSSDSIYNSAVLQAVDAAQPLPVPEDLGLLSEGVTLEFKPEE